MFFVQGRRWSVSFKSRFLSANFALLGVMIKNRHANYIFDMPVRTRTTTDFNDRLSNYWVTLS